MHDYHTRPDYHEPAMEILDDQATKLVGGGVGGGSH